MHNSLFKINNAPCPCKIIKLSIIGLLSVCLSVLMVFCGAVSSLHVAPETFGLFFLDVYQDLVVLLSKSVVVVFFKLRPLLLAF